MAGEEERVEVTEVLLPAEARSYSYLECVEIYSLDITYGGFFIRPEWVVEAPVSWWRRMAQNALALAQVTRDAVRLFRNSNTFLQRQDVWQWPEQTSEEWQRAKERSFELLKAWLDPQQLASFQEHQYFEVTGSDSGVRYRLRPQSAFGIEALTGRRKGTLYCVVPTGAPALGDILLAQKIGLETNERATLARANKNYGDSYL